MTAAGNWCLAMGPNRGPEDHEFLRESPPVGELFILAPEYVHIAPVCMLDAGHVGPHDWVTP